MNVFAPERRYQSPSRRAVVSMPAGSEPAFASRRAASSACPRSKNGRSSTSVELGRSLGDERGVELAEVSRLHAEGLPLRFRFDGGREVQIELRIKQLFRHPDGKGGPVGE